MALLKKLRGLLRRRPVDLERALRVADAEAQRRAMRERTNPGWGGGGGLGEGGL
jgi:hypothetical protein